MHGNTPDKPDPEQVECHRQIADPVVTEHPATVIEGHHETGQATGQAHRQ